jgi:hypothetical protein
MNKSAYESLSQFPKAGEGDYASIDNREPIYLADID